LAQFFSIAAGVGKYEPSILIPVSGDASHPSQNTRRMGHPGFFGKKSPAWNAFRAGLLRLALSANDARESGSPSVP
jgi:hypothetical protein